MCTDYNNLLRCCVNKMRSYSKFIFKDTDLNLANMFMSIQTESQVTITKSDSDLYVFNYIENTNNLINRTISNAFTCVTPKTTFTIDNKSHSGDIYLNIINNSYYSKPDHSDNPFVSALILGGIPDTNHCPEDIFMCIWKLIGNDVVLRFKNKEYCESWLNTCVYEPYPANRLSIDERLSCGELLINDVEFDFGILTNSYISVGIRNLNNYQYSDNYCDKYIRVILASALFIYNAEIIKF